MANQSTNAVLAVIHQLHDAQAKHDLDGMLAPYATGQFLDPGTLKSYYEQLIERDRLRNREVDWSACEVFVAGEDALVRPVVYQTEQGARSFSFHLKEIEGAWKIIDSNRSFLPGTRLYTDSLVAHAGKVIGSRSMMWIRYLDAPVETVWQLISTKAGLEQWWLTRTVDIDLRVGGRFDHHWSNTVRSFKENAYIDYVGMSGDGSQEENLMRLEIRPEGDGTLFTFIDGFMMHPLPLSLPWTASGWHHMVNALESVVTGRDINEGYDYGLGGEFYFDYLRHHHATADALDQLASPQIDNARWREAYLTTPQPVSP